MLAVSAPRAVPRLPLSQYRQNRRSRRGHRTLPLTDSPKRFLPVAGAEWTRKRSSLVPGWHVFQFAQTSAAYACDVVVSFTAAKLSPTPAAMRLFIPGVVGREYSQALPPVTKESPAPYDHAPAPVLVIRQRGEAWTRPFAVIYEPTVGAGAIKSVTALAPRGEFSSFKVVSQIAGRQRADLVLVLPTADSVFEDVTFGLSFRGS